MKQPNYHRMMDDEKAGARIITYALAIACLFIVAIFIWCVTP
jgi:hypothetical protein